ncbi:hypothetical protein F7R01_10185 [Pseudomonas argentinensis]|uniref:DUF3509 domain-containing protein n=1 Tax=Phytopseudomonas argentinensis TaxID=289370 RepID=A0A1I3I7V3_9GAMM|nr:hypothetical protein [Pseudomonas argentinensis]KAB0547864.1 hypothetical protein F7R01_10185 [Pseudomonas argentinensis]SFI44085.1 hypothetical protein SAMN05216602_1489 [Pseudomonas argentinensis]
MNTYLAQLAVEVAERYVIQTERHAEGLSISCRDLKGNLVASRILTAKQLRNASLVSLVMADLKSVLLAPQPLPPITPLPESLHPSAS